MPQGGTADPGGGGRGQRGGPDSGGRGGRGGGGRAGGVGGAGVGGGFGPGSAGGVAGGPGGRAGGVGTEGVGGGFAPGSEATPDADSGGFTSNIVGQAIAGIAGLAGTALAGPIGGIAASAGIEALLGDTEIGLGDLGLDFDTTTSTGLTGRRSVFPDRQESTALGRQGPTDAAAAAPDQTPSPSNTTTGQGGVARGVSGGQRSVPANRSLLSSLATTSRKTLLGT